MGPDPQVPREARVMPLQLPKARGSTLVVQAATGARQPTNARCEWTLSFQNQIVKRHSYIENSVL
jgi:hypothetical protein